MASSIVIQVEPGRSIALAAPGLDALLVDAARSQVLTAQGQVATAATTVAAKAAEVNAQAGVVATSTSTVTTKAAEVESARAATVAARDTVVPLAATVATQAGQVSAQAAQVAAAQAALDGGADAGDIAVLGAAAGYADEGDLAVRAYADAGDAAARAYGEARTSLQGRNPFRKRVLLNLPLRGNDHATICATYGYSYLYPQGFVVDEAAGELLVIKAPSGGANTWQWVEVYSWPGGVYRRTFSAGDGVGEGGGVVFGAGGTRALWLRDSATQIGRYDLSTPPANLARLTPTQQQTIGAGVLQFSFGNGLWAFFSRQIPLASNIRRNRLVHYDASFARRHTTDFGWTECGWAGTEGTGTQASLPKTQGFCLIPGGYAVAFGGYHGAGQAVTPYRLNGIKLFAGNGRKIADCLLNPEVAIATLNAAGIVAERLESEGCQYLSDGRLLSLQVCRDSSTTSGMLVMEEFAAGSEGVIDFSAAAVLAPYPGADLGAMAAQFPLDGSSASNPFTGATLASWADLLDFMVVTDLPVITYYTSSYNPDLRVNAGDAAAGTLPAGMQVTIRNSNNSTFIVEAVAASNNAPRRWRITTSGGVRTTAEHAVQRVTSGASATITAFARVVEVNKATGSATALSWSAAPAQMQEVVVKDGKGDAAANPITITAPAGWTIDATASVTINTNFGAVRLLANTATSTLLVVGRA